MRNESQKRIVLGGVPSDTYIRWFVPVTLFLWSVKSLTAILVSILDTVMIVSLTIRRH